ncbi:MAG: AAA family ATPase [Bacillota bacterium]|nr:AAA family ATPase [Bacillota bacterium]
MLTRLVVRRFKLFEDVEIPLGNPVVFIGPNNSGKTAALQALSLWDAGLKRWLEKRGGRKTPEKRTGVAINRRDLVSVPVPDAKLLWRALRVRDHDGNSGTRNIRVEIIVDGIGQEGQWTCGLEFDYANEESIYCRPLGLSDTGGDQSSAIPPEAAQLRVTFLPPMSGLAANETRLDPGAINVRLGEGRTNEVLRNICYQVLTGADGPVKWAAIRERTKALFGVVLDDPVYVSDRGELTMSYRDRRGTQLDLSSAGRGLHQTLLVLAHIAANPDSVLLLDEPDAHLEILRQRQMYHELTRAAVGQKSQIVIASHSEVVLNEAADRDVVVAFVGHPHRIDDRGSHLLKSLKEIGFDQYYQAEQVGWVLYLEGSTDLAILKSFASTLGHSAMSALERPFVYYVANLPTKAREHFHGLREAKENVVGLALFDNGVRLQESRDLVERMWGRREIENYLCYPDTLLAWARAEGAKVLGPMFATIWEDAMRESMKEVERAATTILQRSPWDPQTKVSDEFLSPLFADFYRRLGLPNLMLKSDYHILAQFVSRDRVDGEVTAVLDAISEVAGRAQPEQD